MSLLDIIWNFFRAPAKTTFRDMPEISIDEVRKTLEPFEGQVWISDEKFKLLNTFDLIKFLNENNVNTRKYITDFLDCDDYSYELMGDITTWNPAASFGMIWGNKTNGYGHAWNFFINEDRKVMFVEPQTDEIFEPTTEKSWIMII